MTDKEKVEAKLHGLTKLQDNDWVVKLVMSTEDYQKWGVGADPMGTRYSLDISDAEKEEYEAVYTDPTAKPVVSKIETTEKTEGEKLRKRACILCKEVDFQLFVSAGSQASLNEHGWEIYATKCIYLHCNIKSRKELVTNKEAQEKFKALDRKYKEWLKPTIEEQYPDNISQM